MDGNWHHLLDEHLSRAERALDELAGGEALCTLSRSGRSVPALKYREGAAAAILEARRALEGALPGAEVDIVDDLARHWAAELGRAEDRDAEHWVAYRSGGHDALSALAGDLRGEPAAT